VGSLHHARAAGRDDAVHPRNSYQIVRHRVLSPSARVVHDARIVPLDGRPHVSPQSGSKWATRAPLGRRHARRRDHQLQESQHVSQRERRRRCAIERFTRTLRHGSVVGDPWMIGTTWTRLDFSMPLTMDGPRAGAGSLLSRGQLRRAHILERRPRERSEVVQVQPRQGLQTLKVCTTYRAGYPRSGARFRRSGSDGRSKVPRTRTAKPDLARRPRRCRGHPESAGVWRPTRETLR